MDLSFCFSCFLCSVCYSILLLLFLLLLVKGISINSHFDFAFGSSSKRKVGFNYHLAGEMNIIMMQNLTERLRPLVGLNGWDYCVYWKLSEDQRFLEWLGCCCGGTENNQNGGEDHLFPVSSVGSCRDNMFPHARTRPCDLLSQLSTSIPIDSGNIHAQTLLTNQPNWVSYSNSLDPNILEETIGTQVLIPVPGGLVELFVSKQVSEDQQIIDFVTGQCIVLVEQEAANNSVSFNIDVNSMTNMMQPNPLPGDENEGNNNNNNRNNDHFQPPISLTTASETSHDIPISLCSSPLNFMQQFNNYNPQNRMKNNDAAFSEEYQGGNSFLHDKQNNTLKSTPEEEEQHDNNSYQKCMVNDTQQDLHGQYVDPSLDTKDHNQVQGHDKDLLKHVVGRSDSVSDCSDQNEEEDDGKYRRRNGKGNQSKNLVAERKRRKKLNDRLYNLRSLVPRISKLDRASILGDAIEFVKDLQKQVKELQDELEENSDTGAESNCINNNNGNNNIQFVGLQPDIVRQQNNGSGEVRPKGENVKTQNGFHVGASGNNGYMPKQKQEVDATTIVDKQTQQMEPQVEVALIDGNEYFVKVFCEHRPGGFVRLMEALSTLGMDVVHATVTSHKGLVSNVFKVEKKDSEMVEAEDVRDSLLELTRNPSRGWSTNETITATSENNGVGRDQHHHLHNHQMGAYHPHPFHSQS